jgi:hypothetical protein
VKTIWTSRVTQMATKYGEVAPTATVCCNACRTCVQTNLLAVATAGVAAVGVRLARLVDKRRRADAAA